jgi:hypothetical protein
VEAEERRVAAQRTQRRNRWLLTGAALVVMVAFVVYLATRPPPAALAEIETFPDQGAAHIGAGDPAPVYNSNPPTSGPHSSVAAACGIYREPVPDLNQVHSLEHGVVAIQYDPSLSEQDRARLEDFGRDAPSHIIVAPREGMDQPIALTAWTHRLLLDQVDLAAVSAFYDLYAQFGPERGVACTKQVDQTGEG